MRFPFVLLATLAASPGMARASEPASLTVERGANAESCPDADALTRAVSGVRGRHGAADTSSGYRVVFSHSDGVFQASIESLRDHTTRSLSDATATCDALARATAVTLALLIDADAEAHAAENSADQGSSTSPTQPERRHTPTLVPQPKVSAHDTNPNALTLHAGGGLLLGSIRPVAPIVAGGAGVELRSFSANVGVAWATPGELTLAPGEVSTSFIGISLESCVTLARPNPVRFDACSGLLAGLVRAEARGFTRNEARSRAWLALPIGLGAGADVDDGFALRLHASLLVPARRQDFRVDGLGVAYESPPVAGLLTLRATTRFFF